MKKTINTMILVIAVMTLLFISMPQNIFAQTQSEVLSEQLTKIGIDQQYQSDLIGFYKTTLKDDKYKELVDIFSDLNTALYQDDHVKYLSELTVSDIEEILSILKTAETIMQVKIEVTDMSKKVLTADEILQTLWDDRDIKNIQVIIKQKDDTLLAIAHTSFNDADTIDTKIPEMLKEANDSVELIKEGVVPQGYIPPVTPTPETTPETTPSSTFPSWLLIIIGILVVVIVLFIIGKKDNKSE